MSIRSNLVISVAILPFVGTATALGSDDQTIIAIPTSRTEDLKPLLTASGEAFQALGPKDGFALINSQNGSIVTQFRVPGDRKFTVESIKAREFAAQNQTIRLHLVSSARSEQVSPENFDADILATLSAVAELRRGEDGEAFALLYVNPIRSDENDPQMSMWDDEGRLVLPSDGLIAGPPTLSVFGTADREDRLQGTYITLCAPVPDKLSRPEQDALAHLWGHYIGEQGGTLTGFAKDLPSCSALFSRRLKDGLPLIALSSDDRPAMVRHDLSEGFETIDINRTQSTHEKLNSERLEFERQLAETQAKITRLNAELQQERARVAKVETRLAACESELEKTKAELAEANETISFLKVNPFEGERSISIFQDMRFPGRPTVSVKTGVAYNPDKFPQYENAWCYYQANDKSGVSVRVDVGNKNRGGRVRWSSPNLAALSRIGHSQGDFTKAKSACRFPED